MKFLIKLLVITLSILAIQLTANANVGVFQTAVYSKERRVNLDVTVWYPAKSGGEATMFGGSIFFIGTPAMRDAPISDGKFPLILLSHGVGLGGNAHALSWIAAPLAKQGFIVAAPTHPGNTGVNRSAAETMKLWLRATDIAETLNAMENTPFFKEHLNYKEVGILGFSMGGNTALAMAGARINPKLLASYCDTDALNASLCEWVRQSGIDLHAMDLQLSNRDNHDKRIQFIMAVDPALIDVFDAKTFSTISQPVNLVNLGQLKQIPLTVDASKIAQTIPHATYSIIEDANHFSILAECKPNAAEIAESEKIDIPICTDGGGRMRNEIHKQLITMIVAAFTQALKKT